MQRISGDLFFKLLMVLSFALITCKSFVYADELPRREVTLDWEPIEGAAYYDIELTRVKKERNSKPQTFLVSKEIWSGRLVPGPYQMRLRARDERKVPGDWSESNEVLVQLEKTLFVLPSTNKVDSRKILAKTNADIELEIELQKVPGAVNYKVDVSALDASFEKSFEFTEPTSKVKLPVAKSYKLRALALGNEGLKSENQDEIQITIQGPPLTQPEIKRQEDKFVRQLAWKSDEKTNLNQVSVYRKQNGKWLLQKKYEAQKESQVDFDPSWPGGVYSVKVISTAEHRTDSNPGVQVFEVQNGDRSPAAEYVATLRNSIDRLTGWYLTASYLVTGLTYSGSNSDNAAQNTIQVEFPQNFGGTGRLGLGYLSETSSWGMASTLDMSGFSVQERNPTFASAEFNAVYRYSLFGIGELRTQAGLFLKQVPEIIARNNSEIESIQTITSAGPHLGSEMWWAFTPKLGFQLNMHLYPNLISIKTPTGNSVTNSLSYQFGFLGSYRLSKKSTGLAGYAYRKDAQSYKSNNGKTNSVNLTGHYLNLFLEWAL